MQVRILLFASHREIAGRGRIELELPTGASVGEAYERLTADCPELGSLRRYTTFAVNREVVAADTLLHPGDEVALLQPVSGGAK